MSKSIPPSDSPDYPTGFARRCRVGPVFAVASDPITAAERMCQLATDLRDQGSHVHLINAYTVAIADKDPGFAQVLSNDSINLPDGKPLTWASRIRRDHFPLSQIRGKTFFLNVFDKGREKELRHYLLGSTPEVLNQLQANLSRDYPGATIAGAFSPPFRAMSTAELAAQDENILASGAHVVWVGLGTPKQDYEAKRLAQSLPVVAIAVGAAFDFVAESVKEAPPIFATLGIEWAYRFAKEPRRLWRRYVFGNARFVHSVVRHGRNGHVAHTGSSREVLGK